MGARHAKAGAKVREARDPPQQERLSNLGLTPALRRRIT
jgi:hypothetical protein